MPVNQDVGGSNPPSAACEILKQWTWRTLRHPAGRLILRDQWSACRGASIICFRIGLRFRHVCGASCALTIRRRPRIAPLRGLRSSSFADLRGPRYSHPQLHRSRPHVACGVHQRPRERDGCRHAGCRPLWPHRRAQLFPPSQNRPLERFEIRRIEATPDVAGEAVECGTLHGADQAAPAFDNHRESAAF